MVLGRGLGGRLNTGSVELLLQRFPRRSSGLAWLRQSEMQALGLRRSVAFGIGLGRYPCFCLPRGPGSAWSGRSILRR